MDIRRLKDGYDVLDKLYDDNDLNCDNFAQAVREYRCSHEVITAVANLYLVELKIDTRKFFSICPPVWSIYRQDSHMAAVILFRFSRGIARVIHSTNS